MKKFALAIATVTGGYLVFLKIQENMQRQATWQHVTDPVDF
ncbi:DLW-39 family protein [Trueperella pecoris]|nr:DLW-39 family protein [Trueperella pecoris]